MTLLHVNLIANKQYQQHGTMGDFFRDTLFSLFKLLVFLHFDVMNSVLDFFTFTKRILETLFFSIYIIPN